MKGKLSFHAVYDLQTRVVILGSLPGEISLQHQQYYAHPSNQFWRLMCRVIDIDLNALAYEERLSALLKHGIGLWDVVKSASRVGSGDNTIRDISENRLKSLSENLPGLSLFAFNGGKAAAIGRKQLRALPRFSAIDLPSSSAAYCKINFEEKLSIWLKLREHL